MTVSSRDVNEPTVRHSETRQHGQVPIRWYRPAVDGPAATRVPTIVWTHGGGFFSGGLDQPEAHDVASALAQRGLHVVTVEYSLAPIPGLPWVGRRGVRARGRFPRPMEDLLAVFRSVNSQAAGGVILGGASAGACLASATALKALEMDAAPRGIILAYGFFHSSHPRSREIQLGVRGHRRLTHSKWLLDAMNRNYAGSRAALSHRFAFPGGHELDGFPPTLMINADHDAMRASGDQFATELVSAGVDVEKHTLPGSRHAFLNRPHLDAFTIAIDLMAEWSLTSPYLENRQRL
ncbi:alpha/beta hydrolase [Arthrobacter sp. ISL-95]|uniref:alpha/beta hydrolase n=1 Tax=Arthrobacter sp. ISL-95 TaxID=2819116 RepID=UPI001BE68922|nr:alpha/beta hydrolase fold domain-containing protein [Arthrobacter sp. ISL-95]MBT2585584.1 alpha/beta hydrolase fold domain-containing protein [Arthrobacter sp. ISL-95]